MLIHWELQDHSGWLRVFIRAFSEMSLEMDFLGGGRLEKNFFFNTQETNLLFLPTIAVFS
jgi:hypothetical protein